LLLALLLCLQPVKLKKAEAQELITDSILGVAALVTITVLFVKAVQVAISLSCEGVTHPEAIERASESFERDLTAARSFVLVEISNVQQMISSAISTIRPDPLSCSLAQNSTKSIQTPINLNQLFQATVGMQQSLALVYSQYGLMPFQLPGPDIEKPQALQNKLEYLLTHEPAFEKAFLAPHIHYGKLIAETLGSIKEYVEDAIAKFKMCMQTNPKSFPFFEFWNFTFTTNKLVSAITMSVAFHHWQKSATSYSPRALGSMIRSNEDLAFGLKYSVYYALFAMGKTIFKNQYFKYCVDGVTTSWEVNPHAQIYYKNMPFMILVYYATIAKTHPWEDALNYIFGIDTGKVTP